MYKGSIKCSDFKYNADHYTTLEECAVIADFALVADLIYMSAHSIKRVDLHGRHATMMILVEALAVGSCALTHFALGSFDSVSPNEQQYAIPAVTAVVTNSAQILTEFYIFSLAQWTLTTLSCLLCAS